MGEIGHGKTDKRIEGNVKKGGKEEKLRGTSSKTVIF